jgi:hypothetical protein
MRALLVLASISMLAGAGCGDTTTATGVDMSMSADMSVVVVHDMATLTCAQILTCAQACGANVTCKLTCAGGGSTAAQGKFGALAGCVVGACGPGDGGTGACSSAADTSTGCQTCEGNVGTASAIAGNPCHTEFLDCAAN